MFRECFGLLLSFSVIRASDVSRESGTGIPGTYYKQWTWSPWYDTVSGEEETETYDAIVKRGWKICPDKKNLVASECRIKNTGQTISGGSFFNISTSLGEVPCKLSGIECHHAQCTNFEVRFLCEELMVESGSAVFYFTILAVPVTLILFRLYCWDKIKRNFNKRLRNDERSGANTNNSTDTTQFDPPSYEELFGSRSMPSYNEIHASPIEMGICFNEIHECIPTRTTIDRVLNNNSASYERCFRQKAQMLEHLAGNAREGIAMQDDFRDQNTCFMGGSLLEHGATDISSINCISKDCNEIPPPSYAEALVILKRSEGLDATHL